MFPCIGYLKLAKKLGISQKVKFLGGKPHDELAKIYNMCDIFVLANCQEITPAVNEALACEKPVVVMETGGCKFAIPSNDYGLIAKRFNIHDMADKIITLIKNKWAPHLKFGEHNLIGRDKRQ